MDAKRTHKMIGRYHSGLLSALEVATDLLHEMVSSSEIDITFLSSLQSLPDEVNQEFFQLLEAIREADYRWVPPLLTAPGDLRPDPTEHSAKLREIIAFLQRKKDGKKKEKKKGTG